MLKCCKDALKVTCAVALACALSPVAALAQPQGSASEADTAVAAAQDTTADATVETEIDSSKLQKTDVSKLAKVSGDAADTVKDYIEDRAAEVTGSGSASDDDSLDLAKKVAKTSEKRADSFQQMQEEANIDITDATTTVSVSKVSGPDSKLKVTAYEQTVFYYDDLSDGVGGSDVAMFGTEHTVTVDASGDEPTIKADAFDEDDLNGIDTTGKAASSQSAAAGSAEGATEADADGADGSTSALGALASLVFPQKAYAATVKYDSNYDVQKAIAYADKYWTKYNSKYRNFNPVGGDCANFVSQCMKAGKLNQKKSGSNLWYYNSGSDYSESWTYCPTMVKNLKARGKYYWIPKEKLTTKAAANKIYPGSPVIYNSANNEKSTGSYYHAVICTGYNSAGTPVISAHNNDRYHVPFTYAGNACATIQLTATAPGTTYTTTVSTQMEQGAVEKSKFQWKSGDNKTATITGYNGTSANVTVPETVKRNGQTLQVTAIGSKAFKGDKDLKSVTLAGSVTSIGSCAFQGCTALKTVTAQGAVAKVGAYAFDGCKKLAALPALSQATSIGKRAFRNCAALAKVGGLDAVKSIGTGAFSGCTALASVEVDSAQLAKVGAQAFENDAKLAKIKLKTELLDEEKVGDGAFSGTPKKPEVRVPSKVLKAYKALFVKKGLSSKAKFAKI